MKRNSSIKRGREAGNCPVIQNTFAPKRIKFSVREFHSPEFPEYGLRLIVFLHFVEHIPAQVHAFSQTVTIRIIQQGKCPP
jgi:hypothetical protein